MILAILSDSHDHLTNLDRALELANEQGASHLAFLGDFCAPFSLAVIARGFSGPVDAVFGNNDGDEFLLCQVAAKHPHVTLHGQLAELEIDGCSIALNHYPYIARRLAESRAYVAVFSGHDHERYVHQIGDCLWANPGEIMGRFGEPSIGIFDTTDRSFRHLDL